MKGHEMFIEYPKVLRRGEEEILVRDADAERVATANGFSMGGAVAASQPATAEVEQPEEQVTRRRRRSFGVSDAD